MRFPFPLPIFALVALTCGVSQAAPTRKIVPRGATNFNSKSQGFAIWLPFKPRTKFKVVTLKNGEKILSYSAVGHTPFIIYVVQAFTKPPSVRKQTAKYRLDENQKSYLKRPDKRVLKVTQLRLGRVWGRELEISQEEEARLLRHREYFTAKHLYSLTASGTNAEMQDQTAQITRVFDSFRILPQ